MDFHDCLKSALDYIEEHLSDVIDYDIAARKACCSSYHFQRMFSYIVGVPLSEYIRRRRMTLAAFELQSSDVKVIDLAVKYGYDSQSSFTRAFQSYQGMTPTSARNAGAVIKAYPSISFQILIKGAKDMKYHIEETEAFSFFGYAVHLSPEDTRFENIFDKLGQLTCDPLIWEYHDATNLAAGQPKGTILTGVRFDFKPDGSCKVMFAARLTEREVDDQLTVLPVPPTTWAVFDYEQVIYPQTPEPLYRSIYSEWFPTSGYEQAEGPCFELYPGNRMEAWIPIRRKAQR